LAGRLSAVFFTAPPEQHTMFTFAQIRSALNECTNYDMQKTIDEDGEWAFALIDPFGDQDGDLFHDLESVVDYISNNEQVDEYLSELVTA
jgi:hypothetical protein